MSFAPDTETQLRNVLLAFVSAIDVTGGLTANDGPVADPDWLDLSDVYLDACKVLERDPLIEEAETESMEVPELRIPFGAAPTSPKLGDSWYASLNTLYDWDGTQWVLRC